MKFRRLLALPLLMMLGAITPLPAQEVGEEAESRAVAPTGDALRAQASEAMDAKD